MPARKGTAWHARRGACSACPQGWSQRMLAGTQPGRAAGRREAGSFGGGGLASAMARIRKSSDTWALAIVCVTSQARWHDLHKACMQRVCAPRCGETCPASATASDEVCRASQARRHAVHVSGLKSWRCAVMVADKPSLRSPQRLSAAAWRRLGGMACRWHQHSTSDDSESASSAGLIAAL